MHVGLAERLDFDVVVVGALDPESKEALRVCEGIVPTALATFNGELVDFGTAYRATGLINTRQVRNCLPPLGNVALFEAGVPVLEEQVVRRFDHHQPKDAGFDKLPQDYMQGSSLGQLAAHLGVELNEEQRTIAALDHCASAALADEIPDIDAEYALTVFQNGIRDTHRSLSPQAVVSAYWDAMRVVHDERRYPRLRINGQDVIDLRRKHLGLSTSLARLSTIAALATSGQAALTMCRNPHSKTDQVMLNGHLLPSTVDEFTQEWGPKNGLINLFGVPWRQYAGGMVAAA